MKRSLTRLSAVLGANLLAAGLVTSVNTAGAAAEPVYSLEYLQDIHAQLDAGPKISGTTWGVDPSTKKVLVSYDDTVTGPRLEQLESLTGRFGDAIQFRKLPGVLSAKIGGGVAIFTSSSTGFDNGRCTMGFNAIKNGEYYFFTAGHCTDASVWWYSGSRQQGQLGYRVTSIFPDSDIGIVKYTNSSVPKPGVIARYDGTVQDITHARNPTQGEFVCKSGSTSGYTCGRVTNPRTTANLIEGTVYTVIETNLCSRPGDSGGPLHSGRAALGVLSGGNGICGGPGGVAYFERVMEFQTRDIFVY